MVVGNSRSESRQDGSALDHLPTPIRWRSDSHMSEAIAVGVPERFKQLE